MSVELLHHGREKGRSLRPEEQALLRALLSGQEGFQLLDDQIMNGLVAEMPDGGMGSIRFVGDESRELGRLLAEAEYLDDDGILVSIVVNADKAGRLFEIDFLKVDFSALKQYPRPDALHIKG